ncbi:DUF2066 domain-containing protein [Vibrio gangliei]|uniref:DUF2066 domain-containing protein n=1 Tax=Vibrio gangliei TaxID=2077090 RepID=UPI000D0144E9|nr:DUF2066 domain-containing protein [Vibrio gangliei]
MRYLVVPIIASLIFPFSALAKTKVDIYHAEVVLTQEKNANSVAWSQGLEQVLVKASGDANIANNSVVKKALRDGSDYLAKFKYGTLDGQKSLDMQYNPKQITALLQQANATYWPAERENLLVWLVQDDNVQRQIGWEQSGLTSVEQLQQAAKQAGLPITLPLGDMDDMTKISATDIWGNFPAPLEAASVRYPVDAVLVLKLTQNGKSSELNWQLYDSAPQNIEQNPQPTLTGIESTKDTDAADAGQTIQLAMGKVSQYYAQKNKPSGNAQVAEGALWANFTGIQSAPAFFKLERLLNGLDSVATVQVQSIQADTVTFDVQLLTNEEDFKKQVSQQKGVTQLNAPVDPSVVAKQAAQEHTPEQGSAESDSVMADDMASDAPNSTDESSANQPALQPALNDQLWFDLK